MSVHNHNHSDDAAEAAMNQVAHELVGDLNREVESLRAENERLRAALERYAGHRMACDVFHHIGQPVRPCSCGWSEFKASLVARTALGATP